MYYYFFQFNKVLEVFQIKKENIYIYISHKPMPTSSTVPKEHSIIKVFHCFKDCIAQHMWQRYIVNIDNPLYKILQSSNCFLFLWVSLIDFLFTKGWKKVIHNC